VLTCLLPFSTSDYHKELANITFNRAPTTKTSPSSEMSAGGTSSFFSVPTGYKFFSASTQPDPDKEDAIWTEPEPYSAVITRKEHIRDPTSILSLRDVLRKSAAPHDLGSLRASLAAGTAQPTLVARARPNIGVNVEPADGQVSVTSEDTVEKLLHDLEHAETQPPSRVASRPPSFVGSDKGSTKDGTHKATPASFSSKSESTVGKATKPSSVISQDTASDAFPPPPVPQKDPPKVPPKDGAVTSPGSEITSTNSSFASALASHLGTAVRYVVGNNQGPTRPTSPLPPKPHSLLAGVDFEAVDERPHIKYDWTIGKRLKFSCTVYYAKQFDSLRRRCGIEDSFVKSLSKSTNWAADGGKSRSNFWKTSDNKFIIKTLVNAWNVADL
jgi:1-phosphatidylinositol-3-phosphate 5-kinase